MLDQPLASVLSASFLVRHEGEHQITRRYDAFRLELSGEGQDHPDHVLHVHGAAPPDVTVLDGAGKGMDAPVGGLGRNDVEVTVKHQCTSTRLSSLQAGKDVPAAGRTGLDVFRLVADFLKLRGNPLRARTLTLGGFEFSRVRGVEADERTDQFDYFCFGSARIRIIRGCGHSTFLPSNQTTGATGMPRNLAIWGSSPNRILFPSTEKSGPSPSGGMADALA